MSLTSLRYSEFKGEERFWEMKECDFQDFNLVVGRNATGKTRFINVLVGLIKILTGRQTDAYSSGSYKATLALAEKVYIFEIEFKDGKVVKEVLSVGGAKMLIRNRDGVGKIFYERLDSFIDFHVDEKVIAFQQRVDELQHPFIAEVAKWALGARAFFFNTSFSNTTVRPLTHLQEAMQRTNDVTEQDVVGTYFRAYGLYSDPFDVAIKRDMKKLGYHLTDVGITDVKLIGQKHNISETLIGVFATEKGIDINLPSSQMSQGMFRALGLIIYMNAVTFAGDHTIVLVDDIGEGLDYERSVALIDVLREHSSKGKIQVITTTNDRFVMNRVPLENWVILRRRKSTVRAFTERNSREIFNNFRYMGLSNFDLFSSPEFR
jgi:energy-coupling factor transporter ATP-binding protein EcfA2